MAPVVLFTATTCGLPFGRLNAAIRENPPGEASVDQLPHALFGVAESFLRVEMVPSVLTTNTWSAPSAARAASTSTAPLVS